VRGRGGQSFDLRDIKSPIILFASMGDNITPPQQAFNWVADVYGSTEEIKARGQVIVGLLHQDVGHLGIFVSCRIAKKEHAQIVSVLKSIEALPPGLYGMQIIEQKATNGKAEYEVQFVERRLEEVTEKLNRFERADEKPFQAVEKISEFNQQAYELFARPLVQAMSNDLAARISRQLHPLRVQHWGISDLNPWLMWLGPTAEFVKAQRQALPPDHPSRQSEKFMSECVSSALDFYREIRDALSEAMFFEIYGGLFETYFSAQEMVEKEPNGVANPRDLPFVKQALESMAEGGYPEAVARVFALLSLTGKPLPLTQLHLKRELAEKFAELLPKTPHEEQRRIRGEQEIIVRYEPERAMETLRQLLLNPADQRRLNALLDAVLTQETLEQVKPTPEQISMLEDIREILETERQTASPRSAAPADRCKTPQRTKGEKRYGIPH